MSERFAASGGDFVSQIRRDDCDTLSVKDANCRMAQILQNDPGYKMMYDTRENGATYQIFTRPQL